jgi:hypothetical protein
MPHSISSASLQSAIGNLKSKLQLGGIAQLVERQLCKLEVRGSNPLASSLRSRRREERRLSRRSFSGGGPFALADATAASYDSASQNVQVLLRLHPAKRN